MFITSLLEEIFLSRSVYHAAGYIPFLVLVTQLLNNHNPTSLLTALLRNCPCKLHCAWTCLLPTPQVPWCRILLPLCQNFHGTGWVGSASLDRLVLGTRRVKRMALSQGQFLDCRSINRSWVSNLLVTCFHSLPVFSCFFLQGGTCNCSSLQPCKPCWERMRSS